MQTSLHSWSPGPVSKHNHKASCKAIQVPAVRISQLNTFLDGNEMLLNVTDSGSDGMLIPHVVPCVGHRYVRPPNTVPRPRRELAESQCSLSEVGTRLQISDSKVKRPAAWVAPSLCKARNLGDAPKRKLKLVTGAKVRARSRGRRQSGSRATKASPTLEEYSNSIASSSLVSSFCLSYLARRITVTNAWPLGSVSSLQFISHLSDLGGKMAHT